MHSGECYITRPQHVAREGMHMTHSHTNKMHTKVKEIMF